MKDKADRIRDALPIEYKQIKIKCFEEVDSTNEEAKRMIMTDSIGDIPALLVARRQLAGHGRLNRRFYSPTDTGLYMSVIIPPHAGAGAADVVSITTKAAVAVVRALHKHTEKKLGIKWVNDVFADDGKICGILAETTILRGRTPGYRLDGTKSTAKPYDPYVTVGIGINLTTSAFPEEFQSKAGAVEDLDISQEELAARITKNLLNLANDDSRMYLGDYRSYSTVIGKEIVYGFDIRETDKLKHGLAVDIDENGGLIIKHEDGTLETLHSGEISVRLEEDMTNPKPAFRRLKATRPGTK